MRDIVSTFRNVSTKADQAQNNIAGDLLLSNDVSTAFHVGSSLFSKGKNLFAGQLAGRATGAAARAIGGVTVGHTGDIAPRWMADESGSLFKVGSSLKAGETAIGKVIGAGLKAINSYKLAYDALTFSAGIVKCSVGR
jgi:hypothetical protein